MQMDAGLDTGSILRQHAIKLEAEDTGGTLTERVVGEIAKVSERIEPGQEGRAELRGTVWTVRNVGEVPLEPGQRVRAEDLEGLVLLVRPES